MSKFRELADRQFQNSTKGGTGKLMPRRRTKEGHMKRREMAINLLKQYRWLLHELYHGNEFSKEHLWTKLQLVEEGLRQIEDPAFYSHC